jgi:hypothetical protein
VKRRAACRHISAHGVAKRVGSYQQAVAASCRTIRCGRDKDSSEHQSGIAAANATVKHLRAVLSKTKRFNFLTAPARELVSKKWVARISQTSVRGQAGATKIFGPHKLHGSLQRRGEAQWRVRNSTVKKHEVEKVFCETAYASWPGQAPRLSVKNRVI